MSNLLHSGFRWNGVKFSSVKDLLSHARTEYPETISFLNAWFSADGLIGVRTSGSTGSPKTMQLRREQMIRSARATGAYFGLGAGARALHCLPVEYIAGKMMLVRAMVLGWDFP